MPPLSPEHREAVRQSNYRRAEQTRQMNRDREWTPEMRAKMIATKREKAYQKKLEQVQELGLHPNVYKVRVDLAGYVKVGVVDHPHYGTMCNVSFHRVILSERLGRRPTPDEQGHHIDEDKLNNLPENIQLLLTSEHMSYHARKTVRSEESNRKRSETMKGRPAHPNTIAAHAGKKWPEERREAMRTKSREAWARRRAEGRDKIGMSDVHREKIKAGVQRAWDRRRGITN